MKIEKFIQVHGPWTHSEHKLYVNNVLHIYKNVNNVGYKLEKRMIGKKCVHDSALYPNDNTLKMA